MTKKDFFRTLLKSDFLGSMKNHPHYTMHFVPKPFEGIKFKTGNKEIAWKLFKDSNTYKKYGWEDVAIWPEQLKIYDNKGKTFDRYTIIFPDRTAFGCSENPLSPLGFVLYVGVIEKERNCNHLGQKVEFETLNPDVKKYINLFLENQFANC